MAFPLVLAAAGSQIGMQAADYAVIVIYLVGITLLGLWTRHRVRQFGDFAMPRTFGKLLMVFFTFGTGTNPEHAVSVAAKSYVNGISGIWYGWLSLFSTPFYWMIAPVFRRFRAYTTGDVYEARFGQRLARFYSFVGFTKVMLSIAVSLKGGAVMLTAISGGAISGELAIVLLTALFVLYGTAGGLSAAIVTDLVQGMMTIVYSFVLLPLIFRAVGGMEGIRAAAKDPDMLRVFSHGELGVFFVVMLSLVNLLHVIGAPHTMGNCAAGRNEFDGAVGFMAGSFIKRICTIAWALVGLGAATYFVGREINAEQTYGLVAHEFLPQLGAGCLGFFVAALMANMMSTGSALMVSGSTLFTQNLYRAWRPNRSPEHYLIVVRWASVATVAGSVTVAFLLPGFIAGVEIYWKLSSIIGIPLCIALVWRGLTTVGAWTSTLVALFVWWLTTLPAMVTALSQSSALRELGMIIGAKPAVALAWQIFFYLGAGILAGVVVSRFSPGRPREILDTFYALMRTPVAPGEVVTAPCTLPAGTVPPPPRHLFPGTGIELLVPSSRMLAGFAAGWLGVAILLAAVVWIVA